MKKRIFAVAALTGFVGLSSAAKIVVNDQTFADVGVATQIYGQVLDRMANNGKDSAVDFSIQNARIYFLGQLNPIVKFGLNFDFPVTGAKTTHEEQTSTAKVKDAFIDFAFNPLFNVMAGYTRVPFSREDLIGRYNKIFMPQGNVADYFMKQMVWAGPTLGKAVGFAISNDVSDVYRDAGVTIWGSYNKGLITYYLGVYDSFGDHNVAEAVNAMYNATGGKDNLGYAIRIQFSPIMLGYQGEGENYFLKETYFGKRKVATVGIAFAHSKLDLGNGHSFSFNSWTLDANYEAPYGVFVPKVTLAYVYNKCDNFLGLDKSYAYKVKLGTLYNQKVWLGKLGAYLQYQKTTFKYKEDGYKEEQNAWTFAVPYYLQGQQAKIVAQVNYYNYKHSQDNPRADKKSNTDFTLAFQVQF
jgi:hypothetical protein